MGILGSHPGSWFGGLPDFGVTEAIGNALGAPQTSQGGSNILTGGAPTQWVQPTQQPVPNNQFNYAYPRNTGSSFNTGNNNGQNPGTQNGMNSATTNPPTNSSPSNNQNAENNYQSSLYNRIGSGFDSYINSLDTQLGLLPQHYQALKGNIDSVFGDQSADINTERTNDMASLDSATNQANTNRSQSIRDLGTDFNSALDAANAKLGAVGASSSSASPMYAYALGLQANKNRGNIETQWNGLMNDINLKRTQVTSTLDNEMEKLDNWKNSQISSLDQWLASQQSAFANAKGMAQEEKQKALASLDESALGRLQQLDDQHTQMQQAIQQWALNHQTALDSALAYAKDTSAIQVDPFQRQLFDTTIQSALPGNSGSDIYGYNPFLGVQGKFDQNGNAIG